MEAGKGPKFVAELVFLRAVDDTRALFLTACSRWLVSVKSCAASNAFKAARPKNAGLEAIVDAPTVEVLEILKKKVEELRDITSKMDSDSLLGLREGHAYLSTRRRRISTCCAAAFPSGGLWP